MATYYVRPDGNDGNTGLGSSAAQAWRTFQKALGATGIGSGDTVYIAPGVYRENVVIGGTYTSQTNVIGDTRATQFTDIQQGLVRITNYLTTDLVNGSGWIIQGATKNYISMSNIYFDIGGGSYGLVLGAGTNWNIDNCAFIGSGLTSQGINTNSNTGQTVNIVISRCIFMTGQPGIYVTCGGNHTSDWTLGFTVRNCAFYSCAKNNYAAMFFTRSTGTSNLAGGINIYNCYIHGSLVGAQFDCGNPTYPTLVKNCLILNCDTGLQGRSTTVNTEDYNRILGSTNIRANVSSGANTITSGPFMIDAGMSHLFGLSAKQAWFSPLPSSLNIGFGDPVGASSTDLLSQTWFNGGSDPDAGALTSIQLSNTSYYYATERNASVMSMQAGSTSRSLYLYLGATGLTATTTGLQAYYTKEDAIPVSIPLVAQTTTGAWVSGGFAEVSAANQPGVYRLDIPNAAISAGYTQTVVTVRGASGTNGAVVVIQEPPVLGSQVRMGPFTVQADGVLTDERLKLYKGSIHSIDFKMVDQYGTGVDGTGTVVTANVYNSAGFLVDSYPCTAKYAEDGRYSFAIDATVTNVVGMYTINISRQIGSEINVFGRMKLEVLSP